MDFSEPQMPEASKGSEGTWLGDEDSELKAKEKAIQLRVHALHERMAKSTRSIVPPTDSPDPETLTSLNIRLVQEAPSARNAMAAKAEEQLRQERELSEKRTIVTPPPLIPEAAPLVTSFTLQQPGLPGIQPDELDEINAEIAKRKAIMRGRPVPDMNPRHLRNWHDGRPRNALQRI